MKNLEAEFQLRNKLENYQNILYTILLFLQRLFYFIFHMMQIEDFRLNPYEYEMFICTSVTNLLRTRQYPKINFVVHQKMGFLMVAPYGLPMNLSEVCTLRIVSSFIPLTH